MSVLKAVNESARAGALVASFIVTSSVLALSPACMAAKSTITFAFWGQKPVLVGYEESKKDFEKLHPGVVVKLLWMDPGTYAEKITTMFAGGSPPDVMWYECNHGAMQPWIVNNMLLPLDSYIKTDKLDVNALFGKQLMNAQRYDGKYFGKAGNIYGLPKGWNTDALVYNSTMFSNVGLLPPADSWTWDDLVESGKKLTKRDGNGAFTQMAMMNPADPWNFILQGGGGLIDESGGVILNSPGSIEGMRFWAELGLKHQISTYPGLKGALSGSSDAMMMKDKNAMEVRATWFATSFLKDKNPSRFGVALQPTGKVRDGMFYVGGIGVSKSSKHRKDAWEWVKFITTDKRANLDHGMSFDEWPPLMSVCRSSEMVKPPTFKGFDRSKFLQQLESSTLRPAPTRHGQRVTDAYQPEFNFIQSGRKDPAVALKSAADQIRRILGTK